MTNMSSRRLLLILGILWMGTARASSTEAISVSGGVVDYTVFQYTIGNQFTTLQNIAVTDIGVFSISGLAQSYEVGLWDSFGNLLATATVDSTLDVNQFEYVSITPVSLAAGESFCVGELINSTAQWLAFSAITPAPGLVFDYGLYDRTATPSLTDPTTSTVGLGGSVGPSFKFTSVPEPRTFGSLFLSLFAMTKFARKLRVQP